MSEWIKELAEMKDAAKAYRELCTCYRVGKQPSERLFKRLEKANDLLDTPEPPKD
jgi:hypothetical protein